MPTRALRGIFCLEGEWDPNLRGRNSVEPILSLFERLQIAKTIRRDVATREELAYYLKKWCQRGYGSYKVLYLATHGCKGTLHLGKDTLDVNELATMLENKCTGRVIYFGSCLTLALTDEQLQQIAKVTGAKAVVGYCKAVDWLDSAAFELLALDRIISGSRTDAFFNRFVRDHAGFAKELGLIVATPSRVYNATKLAMAA
jgi:uncharacterized protein DUF6642